MADTTLVTIDPVQVTTGIIREMIYSDLVLRSFSLDQLNRDSIAPGLLLARIMRGKLSFALTISRFETFLFYFKTAEDRDKIADVRIRFALVPSMAPQPNLDTALQTELELPTFLANSPRKDIFHFRLADNKLAVISFGNDGKFTMRLPNGPINLSTKDWPLTSIITLIEGIANQIRNNEIGETRPFTIPADPYLGKVLKRLVDSYRKINDITKTKPSNPTVVHLEHHLRKQHPDLVGNYRLSELFSRVLVWIDNQGNLVKDRSKSEAQQLDVETRVIPVGGGHCIRYRFRIPDLLVAGEYHQHFLQAVRSDKHASKFLAVANQWGWDEKDFHSYLDDPEQDRFSLFIRTNRRTKFRKKDRDLVILQGSLAGRTTQLLFEVDFNVNPYPDITITDIEVRDLLGLRFGTEDWQWHQRKALPQQYISRLIRTLRVWQKGII